MLNARQVEAFRATILTGSVSAAARRLHISQPSVSRLLSDLEQAVGFKLFSRSGRGVVPSPEALLLFDEVDRVFVGLSELERVAREVRALARGSLRVGAPPALSIDAIADVVADLYRAVGRLGISIEVGTSHQILGWVRAGQIDVGLVNLWEGLDDVEQVAEWRYRCVCLMPANHRLAGTEAPLDIRELRGEPIIALDSQFMMSICPDQETAEVFRNAPVVKVGMWAAAPPLVRNNLGIAVIDPFTAHCFVGMSNLVLKELRQDLRFDLSLIRPAGRPHSLITQKFSDLAITAFSRWQSAGFG